MSKQPHHATHPPAGVLTKASAQPSALLRYFFNLTNGETVIRDDEGVKVASIQAAAIAAMSAIEELRADDQSGSEEWQGWRLEIIDASGALVQSIPLEMTLAQ
jgi:hypothetical protein